MNDANIAQSTGDPLEGGASKRLDWQFDGKSVRILFLCVNNSARSQMAEALTRHLSQGQVEAFSAGSQPTIHIHPLATHAIARLGADMSQYVPKSVDLFKNQSFDRVIILCDPEQEETPAFPHSATVVIWNMPDPRKTEGTDEDMTRAFNRLAIELNTRIRLLLTLLEREKRASA